MCLGDSDLNDDESEVDRPLNLGDMESIMMSNAF